MYRKNCDRCHRPSFSSSEFGEWLCPVCGHDLTSYPFFNALTLEKAAILPRLKRNAYKTDPDANANDPSSDLWG